jgi:NNP family nitrate/nitrite transporter-like MFS transporter
MYMVSWCDSYWSFILAGLGFGFTGTSFAVGIAFSSVWFSSGKQGTALGIFGAGNAGAALTSLGAPHMLNYLTQDGANIEGWRNLPKMYAVVLLIMGVVFLILANTRIPVGSKGKTMLQRLKPLGDVKVWRFGLYYFFVFGGFVALAQWLIPYYVNAYSMTVVMAGTLAAANSLPSGLIRAAGGWMSDRWGAQMIMYWVFGLSLACCALLVVPQMDIQSPGSGIMARRAGTVSAASATAVVVETTAGPMEYALVESTGPVATKEERVSGMLIWPRATSWQEPAVEVGEEIKKKQLIARGVTHIFFQANVWVFTILSLILGSVMGIGKAAVYKHIPDYFPDDVGVVGGIVGVLGGIGGFICPIVFGYLLKQTGLWTTCWMFFFVLVLVCLIWMHMTVRRMMKRKAPEILRQVEDEAFGTPGWKA